MQDLIVFLKKIFKQDYGVNFYTCFFTALPTVVIQQPSYSTNYGNSVTLVCTVTAVPFQTKVYWRKDNTLLINAGDNGYSGSTPGNPSLTINSATTSSQGQYRCYAENPVGNGNSDITTLTVIGGIFSTFLHKRKKNNAKEICKKCKKKG